ncbi:hypothetical protein PR002_g16953 [Phytophthora rubi]|uniref:Crinkler effector protein N-terminal domain-containing protein n=1 Tax=Phytophthora rubi TaxID=129364 RepID=A0A6A3KGX8_9STRA|nr:hypothetical protein PR002_g16953 [Phytophthora rubi]
MVKLFCAIAGVAGIVFSVKIDEGNTVAKLKKKIKKENKRRVKCDALDLQLFLAKRKTKESVKEEMDDDKEEWLTQLEALEGGIGTSGYKKLCPGAQLRDVGLVSGELGEVGRARPVCVEVGQCKMPTARV